MTFRYVPFDRVPAMLALGWLVEGELHAPHGLWSCLMVWLCDCQVPELEDGA